MDADSFWAGKYSNNAAANNEDSKRNDKLGVGDMWVIISAQDQFTAQIIDT